MFKYKQYRIFIENQQYIQKAWNFLLLQEYEIYITPRDAISVLYSPSRLSCITISCIRTYNCVKNNWLRYLTTPMLKCRIINQLIYSYHQLNLYRFFFLFSIRNYDNHISDRWRPFKEWTRQNIVAKKVHSIKSVFLFNNIIVIILSLLTTLHFFLLFFFLPVTVIKYRLLVTST